MAPALEVIACSLADAVEAERGGASRLEVISHFEVGGLTPPLGLVREIISAVRLPVRVMVRERPGYMTAGEAERERLCATAGELAALGVDGLVLGFLQGREVDLGLMARVLSAAPQVKVTFHRAFEEVREPLTAIRRLKGFPQVDRILTSGGSGDWPQKVERLANYARDAAPEITLLAGGGVDGRVIKLLCEATPIREFHVGSAARIPPGPGGVVGSSRVRELKQILLAC